MTGCLAIGLVAGWLVGRPGSEQWRLLIATGLLGGFTTFSAFALEVAELSRTQPMIAAGYAAATLGASLLAVFAGLALAR